MAEKAKSGDLKAVNGSAASQAAAPKRKRRWDQTADQTPNATPKKLSSWDQADSAAEVPNSFVGVHLTFFFLCLCFTLFFITFFTY